MSDQSNIPILTDLIEKGIEITMSDLGLDDDPQIEAGDAFADDTEIDITEPDLSTPDLSAIDPLTERPELEQTIRRILDQHLELAWHEIQRAIRRELKK